MDKRELLRRLKEIRDLVESNTDESDALDKLIEDLSPPRVYGMYAGG